MPKLSKAQIEALKAAPFDQTFWGGKPMARWPGPFTYSTVYSLKMRGLLKETTSGFQRKYHLTETGREVLAANGR